MAIEGFALETADQLVFTVKGHVHPPHRTVAYLRYLPDPSGDRVRGGTRFRRVYGFRDQEALLRPHGDLYLAYDAELAATVQSVPWERVSRVHDPRLRLEGLLRHGRADHLERATLGLLTTIARAAQVPLSCLGVTGSILVGLHHDSSDIDVVVYGDKHCRTVAAALRRLLDEDDGPITRPRPEHLGVIHEAHSSETPLDAREFARLQARKVNECRYQDRSVFVRFVKLRSEAAAAFGAESVENLGPAEIRARVTDAADALFTPCRYGIDSVSFLSGEPVDHVRDIVSFRGRFAEQLRDGETALARGTLERVVPRVPSDSADAPAQRTRTPVTPADALSQRTGLVATPTDVPVHDTGPSARPAGAPATPYCRLVVGGSAGDYLAGAPSSAG